MSLEELRAQVEADETPTEEAQPTEAVVEATEEEESTDFELELEGEPEPSQQRKPSAEEALIHKLTKAKKRAKSAEEEKDVLLKRVEELEKRLAAPQQEPQRPPVGNVAEPKMPDIYDPGIDGDRAKYDQAVKKFLADYTKYQGRHSEAEQAQADYKQIIKAKTETLAKRAATFATENKVSIDRVAEALELATADIDAAVNLDGALAHLLDTVGDGSERIAYYLGTNESARSQIKAMLKDDPTGLKAIAHMTRLSEKLKPKQRKQLSKAPEPDQPLQGDAISSMSASQLQSEWDRTDGKDFEKLRKLRQKARELGVTLKT